MKLWSMVLVPEAVEYGGGSMEMALNTGGKTYSADDIARLRAGRLLLNAPPPVEETEEARMTEKCLKKLFSNLIFEALAPPPRSRTALSELSTRISRREEPTS